MRHCTVKTKNRPSALKRCLTQAQRLHLCRPPLGRKLDAGAPCLHACRGKVRHAVHCRRRIPLPLPHAWRSKPAQREKRRRATDPLTQPASPAVLRQAPARARRQPPKAALQVLLSATRTQAGFPSTRQARPPRRRESSPASAASSEAARAHCPPARSKTAPSAGANTVPVCHPARAQHRKKKGRRREKNQRRAKQNIQRHRKHFVSITPGRTRRAA